MRAWCWVTILWCAGSALPSPAAELISTDVTRVRSGSAGISETFLISADGRFAVFAGGGTNYITADTNGISDVFVHDCLLRSNVWSTAHALATVSPNAGSLPLDLTPDGRWLAFFSRATNLVAGVTNFPNAAYQLYVHDLAANVTKLASISQDGTTTANASLALTSASVSSRRAISSDGRYVAFVANATNLTAVPDANGNADVFLHDLATGFTEPVSTIYNGVATLDRPTSVFVMSTNARYFAFETAATNVVAEMTNTSGFAQVYWRDNLAGTNVLISITQESAYPQQPAYLRDMSSDGRFVCFATGATNIVPSQNDQNGTLDIFIRDSHSGDAWLVTRNTNGFTTSGRNGGGRFCVNGSRLLFSAPTADLVPGVADVNGGNFDVFVHDLTGRSNAIVSASHTGTTGADTYVNDGFARISASGRFVLFTTTATNLIAGTTGRVQRLYLRDLDYGHTLNPLGITFFPTPAFNEARLAISENERSIFFITQTNYDATVTDTNKSLDLFRAPIYPPRFLAGAPPGQPLQAEGIPGFTYVLESATNFAHWSAVSTNVASPQGDVVLDAPLPPAPRRFYRLLWP